MKYSAKQLQKWRDGIEPASSGGDCIYLERGRHKKAYMACKCYDKTANIIPNDDCCMLNVPMEKIFPPDYLDSVK